MAKLPTNIQPELGLFNDEPLHFVQKESFPQYQSHSDTSFDAACKTAGKSGTLRRSVYELLHERGSYGCIDEEIQILLDMNPSTQRPRRVELVDKGLVIDSGKRRPTKAGIGAVVWICTPMVAE